MQYFITILSILISVQLVSQNEIKYIWCGAVTFNSAKVNARITYSSLSVRLIADEDSTFTSPLYSTFYSVDSNSNYMASIQINNLQPLTKYFYAIESEGIIDSSFDDIGTFTTFSKDPFSYSFVIGSCALNSNHKVFDVVNSMSPNLYINMGDLHYDNPNSAVNINVHRWPYENSVLSKPRLSALLKKVPIAYMWDDHDFCGNNSDGTFEGRLNARRAYHEYVPHYPLAFGNGSNQPVAQSFTIGRVHFILTDLRSERNDTQIMSIAQLNWFENECLYARDNGLLIGWVSTYSWSGVDLDNWAGYASTREEINNFLFCNDIKNLFIMSGDAHMLAIDDGQNGNFSSQSCDFNCYPNFQAAALNGYGSYKGGVYNQGGYYTNPDQTYGQFGLVNVFDSGGDSICISFKGYRVDSTGVSVNMMDSYAFCRNLSISIAFDNLKEEDVSIQPNPSTILSIIFKRKTTLVSLKVYSINGNLVELVQPNSFSSEFSFSFNDLPSAYYILEIETGYGTIKKYWIKNNNQ